MKFRKGEEQTKQICKMLSEITRIASQHLESLFSLKMAKIKAAHSYNPTYILNGPVLLFREVHQTYPLSEEYGLEKVMSCHFSFD